MNELPSLSTLDAWCDNCRALKQELEDVRQEYALRYVSLKDKIIPTDKLIKQYTSKCQKYDALVKKLEEAGRTSDGYKRNCETLETQLKAVVDEVEPLRKSVQRLERGKEKNEAQILELKNQLDASKAGKLQDNTMMQKMASNYQQLEDNFSKQAAKLKDLEAKLRKSETANKKLIDEQQQRRNELIKYKKEKSQLSHQCSRFKEIMKDREQLLHKHGIPFRSYRIRTGNMADADSDEDEEENKDAVKNVTEAGESSASSPRRVNHFKSEPERDEMDRLRDAPIDAMFARIFADLGDPVGGRSMLDFGSPLSPALSMLSSDGEADDEAVDSAAELVESELLASPQRRTRASRPLQRSASASDADEKPTQLRRSLRGRKSKMVPSSLASHGMLELQESISDPEQDGADVDTLLPFTEFKEKGSLSRDLTLSSSDSDSDTPFNNVTPPSLRNNSKAIINDNIAKRCPNKGYGKLGETTVKTERSVEKTTSPSDDSVFKTPLPVSPRRARGRLRTLSDSSNDATSPRRVTRSMSSPASYTSDGKEIQSKNDDSPPQIRKKSEEVPENVDRPEHVASDVTCDGLPAKRRSRRLSCSETSSESESDEVGVMPLRRGLRSSSASSDDSCPNEAQGVKVLRKTRNTKRNTKQSDLVTEMKAKTLDVSNETESKLSDSSTLNGKDSSIRSKKQLVKAHNLYAGFVSGGMLQDSMEDVEHSQVPGENDEKKPAVDTEDCKINDDMTDIMRTDVRLRKKRKLSESKSPNKESCVHRLETEMKIEVESSTLGDDREVNVSCEPLSSVPPARITRSRKSLTEESVSHLTQKDGSEINKSPPDNVPKADHHPDQPSPDTISDAPVDSKSGMMSQNPVGENPSDESFEDVQCATSLASQLCRKVFSDESNSSAKGNDSKPSDEETSVEHNSLDAKCADKFRKESNVPKTKRKSEKYLSRQLSLHSDESDDDDGGHALVTPSGSLENQVVPSGGVTDSPQALTSSLLADHQTAFKKVPRRSSEQSQSQSDSEIEMKETGNCTVGEHSGLNNDSAVDHSTLPHDKSTRSDGANMPVTPGPSETHWLHHNLCTPKVICSDQGEAPLNVDDCSLGSVEFSLPITSTAVPYDQTRHFVSLANQDTSSERNSEQLETSPPTETPSTETPTIDESQNTDHDVAADDPQGGRAMQGSPTSFSVSPSSVGDEHSVLSSLPPSPDEPIERISPISPLSSEGHHSNALSPLSLSDTETIGEPLSPLPPTPGPSSRMHTPPEVSAQSEMQPPSPAPTADPSKQSDPHESNDPCVSVVKARVKTRKKRMRSRLLMKMIDMGESVQQLKDDIPPDRNVDVPTTKTEGEGQSKEKCENFDVDLSGTVNLRRQRIAHTKGSHPKTNASKIESIRQSQSDMSATQRRRTVPSVCTSKPVDRKRLTRSRTLKDIKQRLKSGATTKSAIKNQSKLTIAASKRSVDLNDDKGSENSYVTPVLPSEQQRGPKRTLSEENDQQADTKEIENTDDAPSPPKKPRNTDLRVLERELSFLVRLRSMQAQMVGGKLQSLLPHPDAQDIADAVVKILLMNESDLQLTAYTTCSKMKDNLAEWKPLLAEHETKFTELIMLLSKNPDLRNLPEVFLTSASYAILRSDVVAILAKISLMRVFSAICRQMGAVSRLRVMIYDLARQRSPSFFSLLTGAACIWPEVLRKDPDLNGDDPVLMVLEWITLKYAQNKPSHTKMIHCIQILLSWTQPMLDSTDLMKKLLEKLAAETSAQNQEGVFLVVEAMELLVACEKWEWINNTLIIELIWPMLHEWLIQRYATTINQTTIQVLLRLLGFAAQQCPPQHASALQEILKTLATLLSKEQVTDVPVAVQMASVEALLMIAAYEPLRVAIPCYNWLDKNQQHLESVPSLKHNLAQFAKFYHHRLVGLNLKVFGLSEEELPQDL